MRSTFAALAVASTVAGILTLPALAKPAQHSLDAPIVFSSDPNALIPPRCPQFPVRNVPGVLCEGFDTDRNGVPGFQWSRLPVAAYPNDILRAIGDPNDDVFGYAMSGAPSPFGTAALTCAGDAGHLGCQSPVAEENDWHLHSPFEGPGAGYAPDPRGNVGQADGGKAHSGLRSLHMGRHLSATTTLEDTLRLRQVSAFVLDSQGDPDIPGIIPGTSSTLEFWQIISVPDDENFGAGFIPPGRSFGGGQVQISTMREDGTFEKWQRLTPDVNGYDSLVQDTVSLCGFDPGDDLLLPANETMCGNSPLWADLGDVAGTDATCVTDTDGNDPQHKDCGAISNCAPGPGCTENGSIGVGVWGRSTFDLSPYAGRVARLRWIGMNAGGWSFGTWRSALETDYEAYQYFDADDGWWIDDIVLTDLRTGAACVATDDDHDGFNECEGDCDENRADVYPGAPELCDGVQNNCSAPWTPSLESDDDYDGFSECEQDCNDFNSWSWSIPSDVVLDVTQEPGGATTLSWTYPPNPGGTYILYDVLESVAPGDFVSPSSASCLASDLSSRYTLTMAPPETVPSLRFYLVRAQNGCPGSLTGSLGTSSDGASRTGRECIP